MTRYFEVMWHRQLGAGGEGTVYLGRSVTSGRLHAIKFPHALLPSVAQLGLRRELVRVLRVSGRFVARPVAWNLGPRPFAVYEYAELGSLRSEMREIFEAGQVYHPTFALRRVYQMLLGIRDAHRAGFVHRDVKPDNYLLFTGDVLKLSDFGTGRTIARSPNSRLTTVVGTPAYAAPEQLAGIAVDGRADLYSVGVVLYEMLMGHTPRWSRFLEDPSSRFGNALPSLDRLCRRLLARNRWNRPYSVDQALAEVVTVHREYMALRAAYRRRGLISPY